MVRMCIYPACKNKMRIWTNFSFQRLPLNDPETLKLWLVALKMDPNTKVQALRRLDHRVCSAHFSPEDFFPTKEKKKGQKIQRMNLKKNAIPIAAEQTGVSPCAEISTRPEHEAQQMFAGAVKSSSDQSPADKLQFEVRVVLSRLTPSAFAHGLASPEFEAEDDRAQNDRLSCDHAASGIKDGGVERGVQVNLLQPEECTETTDISVPQYIVDEEAILQLMKTCPWCSKQCRCHKLNRGPYFVVYQSCYFCEYRRKWANQPEAMKMNFQKRRARRPKQAQGQCKS